MDKVNQLYMAVKQAGLTGDITGDVIASMLPFGAGAPLSVGGTVHGFVTDDEEVPNDAAGITPGIGESRIIRRLRKVRKDVAPEAKFQRSRILSDVFAPMTFPLAAGTAGALVGADVHNKIDGDAATGAVKGGIAGIAAGAAVNLAAALAAAITNRRTRDEQRAAELEPGLLSHVVPGKGVYNYWKRLGYSKNYDEDAVKARKVVGPDIEKARKLLEEMRNKG